MTEAPDKLQMDREDAPEAAHCLFDCSVLEATMLCKLIFSVIIVGSSSFGQLLRNEGSLSRLFILLCLQKQQARCRCTGWTQYAVLQRTDLPASSFVWLQLIYHLQEA